MHKIVKGTAFAFAVILCGPALAVNDPDEKMPSSIGIIKTGILAKFVSHGTFALPSAAPSDVTPNTIQFFDTTYRTNGTNTYTLTAGTWHPIRGGAGGYKYAGTRTASDPCNVVFIKPTIVKAVCRGSGVTVTTPFSSPFNLGARITVGPIFQQKTYCILMGGTLTKNTPEVFRRIDSLPPASCPTTPTTLELKSTTSSTTSSTSTSTSSSTSTTIGSPSGAFLS